MAPARGILLLARSLAPIEVGAVGIGGDADGVAGAGGDLQAALTGRIGSLRGAEAGQGGGREDEDEVGEHGEYVALSIEVGVAQLVCPDVAADAKTPRQRLDPGPCIPYRSHRTFGNVL